MSRRVPGQLNCRLVAVQKLERQKWWREQRWIGMAKDSDFWLRKMFLKLKLPDRYLQGLKIGKTGKKRRSEKFSACYHVNAYKNEIMSEIVWVFDNSRELPSLNHNVLRSRKTFTLTSLASWPDHGRCHLAGFVDCCFADFCRDFETHFEDGRSSLCQDCKNEGENL